MLLLVPFLVILSSFKHHSNTMTPSIALLPDKNVNHAPPAVLKLCVLQSGSEGCTYEDDDSPADVGQHFVRAGFSSSLVQVENVILEPHTYGQTLVKLARRFEDKEIDCFINLCDGAWDEPSCGIEVVDLLENKLNLPFTGADMPFYEPTRLQMKKAALACGVKVPNWRFVYNTTELDSFLAQFDAQDESKNPLKFPLLPKHFSSYSSIGLIKDSKVWDVENLRIQCERMLDQFGGCLIEEFIIGREFTVLASQVPVGDDGVDVMAYDPVECRFKDGEDFKHYNIKWVDYEEMSWHPVEDKNLFDRLKKLAIDVFKASGGRGYGRMDVRSDPSGENLYCLEVNPNCGIFYPEGLYGSADFILDKVDAKKAHASFALAQVEVAKRLWKNKNDDKAIFEARYDAKTESWGLFALRDIEVGEIIQRNEEAPLHVVTKSSVLRHWEGAPEYTSTDKKSAVSSANTWENFKAYCWPISDNLFAMWSPKPDEWKPINHSCDPNAWNEEGNGLNLVARRRVVSGEEIQMDYATFVGFFPEMKSFDCSCGSGICRGTITGMDIINVPELAQRYHGHMTDYVSMKAREAHGVGAPQ
jgi:D-alanine-D-alanine ligase-like ATP-grasp enzyme